MSAESEITWYLWYHSGYGWIAHHNTTWYLKNIYDTDDSDEAVTFLSAEDAIEFKNIIAPGSNWQLYTKQVKIGPV